MLTIFEAGPQLRADPAGTLRQIRNLGADVIKVFVPWGEVAPGAGSPTAPTGFRGADPNAYPAASWSRFDEIVRDATARGLRVDLAVNSPPLWAAGTGSPAPHPQWRPSAAEFGQFMRALGTRYSGSFTPPQAASPLPRVSMWSLWNEPNYGPDLAPQATEHSQLEVSPALYRALLDAGWSALAATGHGHDTTLIGELAPRGQSGGGHPGDFDGMVPLRFLRALYCVDRSMHRLTGRAAAARACPTGGPAAAFASAHPALFQARGFAVHPYGQGQIPPNQITPGEPDYADLPALPRLEAALDQLLSIYGQPRRIPLYSTEFGYQTDPPEKLAKAASLQTAAYYLNWSEYISWRDPRIASYDQFQLADPPTAGAVGGFATGLEFGDGRPKPTLAAFRMPLYLPVTQASRGSSLELWGGVRPAGVARAQTRRPQRVLIQFGPEAGRFTTLRALTLTGPHGYFDVRQRFPSSGQVRLAWPDPGGAMRFSRTVTITLR